MCLLVVIYPVNFLVVLWVPDSNVMFTSGLEKGGNFIIVSGFYLVTPFLWSLRCGNIYPGQKTPRRKNVNKIMSSIGHREHFGRVGQLTGRG